MNEKAERFSGFALLPVLATLVFYGLPGSVQQYRLVQFLPQIFAYLCMGVWARYNSHVVNRLGLRPTRLWPGIGWGSLTGVVLGICNTMVILWVVPALGGDVSFLKKTPHAHVPTLLMVPWGILFIATMVEINFRGFLLGRLNALFDNSSDNRAQRPDLSGQLRISPGLATAIGTSSLVFAFDPFMVATFRHLHWIALWDGIIWGWMRMQLGNLYAVIMAHALEVVILYLCIKATLT